ncbi:MAG: hypothetical protein R8J85_01585, partial [Mariprofundales bacterium]
GGCLLRVPIGIILVSVAVSLMMGAGVATANAAIKLDASGVTADLNRAELPAMLRLLAAEAGIDLYLDRSISGKVTARFSRLSLPDALARLLRDRSYVLSYDRLGEPRALWLIREGSVNYEVIHGYHGADGINTAFTPHSVSLMRETTLDGNDSGAAASGIAASKVNGAMGAAEVRNQMARQQQVVEREGWHWVTARQQAAMRHARLRRALAQAAPEDRPAIVQQILKLQQQDGVVASARVMQRVAGSKRLATLSKLKQQIALPTQKLARASKRRQLQLAQMRQNTQARTGRGRNSFFRNRNTQSNNPWVMR